MLHEAIGEFHSQFTDPMFGYQVGVPEEGYVVSLWRSVPDREEAVTAHVVSKKEGALHRTQLVLDYASPVYLREDKDDDEFNIHFGEVAGYRLVKSKRKPLCHVYDKDTHPAERAAAADCPLCDRAACNEHLTSIYRYVNGHSVILDLSQVKPQLREQRMCDSCDMNITLGWTCQEAARQAERDDLPGGYNLRLYNRVMARLRK